MDGSAASVVVAMARMDSARCVGALSGARGRGAVAARRMHSATRLHAVDRITIAVPPVRLVDATRISDCDVSRIHEWQRSSTSLFLEPGRA